MPTLRSLVQPVPLELGDRLLLCSDGLTEELEDIQIAQVCQETQALEEIPSVSIEAAKTSGGKDNVTVAIAEYLG